MIKRHTFFINASSAAFDEYQVLAEMEAEKKSLLTLDIFENEYTKENASGASFPIRTWYDSPDGKTKNYEYCANKIKQMIDDDKDVSDIFNLIVYIDLTEFGAFKNIPEPEECKEGTDEKFFISRDAARVYCTEAFRRILRAFVARTLVQKLKEKGCEPQDTLLILDTGCEHVNIGIDVNVIRQYQCELIGVDSAFFRSYSEMRRQADQAEEAVFDSLFMKAAHEWMKDGNKEHNFWRGVKEAVYGACIKQLCESGVEGRNDLTFKTEFDKIDVNCMNQQQRVKTVLYENDRLFPISQIVLYIYLLRCVQNQKTWFFKSDHHDSDDCVVDFSALQGNDIREKIVKKLYKKYLNYDREAAKITPTGVCYEMQKDFTEEISDKYLPLDQYGLDKEGNRCAPIPEPILTSLKKSHDLQTYLGEMPDGAASESYAVGARMSPSQMLAEAQKIKDGHRNLHGILLACVKDWVENYTTIPKETGKKTKLSKRDPNEKRKRYLLSERTESFITSGENTDEGVRTEAPSNKTDISLETFTNQAYGTAKEEYLEGNRVYLVSSTNIDAQYTWLEKKINEISTSIRRLTISTLIACGILLCAYLPFFVIQWKLIFENLISTGAALITFAIPYVLLAAIFFFLRKKEEERYAEAFREFMGKAGEATAQNRKALASYLEFLQNKIPALRYIYECKRDVDCAYRSNKIALGKCLHHRTRLLRRKETVDNILDDLGENLSLLRQKYGKENADSFDDGELCIDYSVAFSCGKTNQEFYSILTEKDINDVIGQSGSDHQQTS